MPPLVALGVRPPNIDTMGAFQQGAMNALGQQAARAKIDRSKFDSARKGLEMIGSIALGSMGGDINGQADPQKFEQGLDMLEAQGVDVSNFRGNPGMAPVVARASLSTLQQLQTAQNDRELDIRLQEFGMKVQKAAQGPKTGLKPIYGTDAEGNTVLMQTNEAGEAVRTQLPEGITPSTGVDRIDLGTAWGLVDKKSGEMVGTVPRNLRGAESEKVIGKEQGEAQLNLGATLQKADNSIQVIDQLIAHPGRETGTGLSSQIDPRNYIGGTDATDFQVMNKQLEGQAFLEAFESLKGGGHITEIEGQKATEAIARLATKQSDEAYVESLKELRKVLLQGKERAKQRVGGGGSTMEITSEDEYNALPSGAVFIFNGKRGRKP